jgi:DNA-binding GntR family transcriptional regulator
MAKKHIIIAPVGLSGIAYDCQLGWEARPSDLRSRLHVRIRENDTAGGKMKSQAAGEPRSTSLAQTAYQKIKQDIIRCELEPGKRISEAFLAKHYGLGRAAIRTAVNRLHQERLIQVLPRQGSVISQITLKHVRDLFGVRVLLEPPAARLSAGQVDIGELRYLDELCRTSYKLGDPESAEAFLRANTEFHVRIAHSSGNDRLAELIAGLLDDMERLFHVGLMLRDRNQEMYHEHEELVDALAARDGERAEAVSREQIEAAQKMVRDALLASRPLESVNLTVSHAPPHNLP